MRKLFPFLLALLLPLAACGDDNGTGPEEEIGSLSFSYTGDTSGTFSVSGEPRQDSNGNPIGEWAVASTSSGGELFIAGLRPTQGAKMDVMFMQLSGVTGPTTIAVCINPAQITDECPQIFFAQGFNGNGETFDRGYFLLSGNVTISAMSSERVRGSFQGTAILIDPTTAQPNLGRTITISNGQFDVPIRNDLD